MKCPNVLGLFTRARVMLVLHANEIRLILPCDSEIDLVLADCFSPPVVQWDEAKRDAVPFAPGVAAYNATVAALDAAPQWVRCWIPVPKYDREWFRNLKPGTKQPGHLWIAPDLTLNEHLVRMGYATRDQATPSSDLYDGASAIPVTDDE